MGMRKLQFQSQITLLSNIYITHRESCFLMYLDTCIAPNALARLVLAGLVDNRETTDEEHSFLNPERQQKTPKN